MSELYNAPEADLTLEGKNTSGLGKGTPLPDGISGFSFGAFFWNWIWAIFNRTWIGLLALVPYIGLIVALVLAFKGREWAWRNKRWESVEHFQRVQRKWTIWALVIFVLVFVVGIGAAIMIPAYQEYQMRANG